MPQIRFRELVPQDVMQDFAANKGGRFPRPQLCRGLHHLVTAKAGQEQAQQEEPVRGSHVCGIVLVVST